MILSSKMLITTYKITRHHNPEYHVRRTYRIIAWVIKIRKIGYKLEDWSQQPREEVE